MNFDVKYHAHELPPETAAKLHELMGRLGLTYGAIDLRLTPEGRYVFLEVNPAGQFLYIEQATGQRVQHYQLTPTRDRARGRVAQVQGTQISIFQPAPTLARPQANVTPQAAIQRRQRF